MIASRCLVSNFNEGVIYISICYASICIYILDLLRIKKPQSEIASIDVESLFTNVPVDDTVQIILEEVYQKRSNGLEKLALSPEILKNLLACTKDAPFRGPDGKLYTQKDGVAMGSPLGPLFANFYMARVEEETFSKPDVASTTYCRYHSVQSPKSASQSCIC